jgi:FAD/FMN-containing dehydrogenase/Fe-S oxidoreductase
MRLELPILNQPRPHEAFHSARELESKLHATVRGEVRFDPASRALYAADASNYRATPIGVVLPHDAADVEATIAACRETGAAVLPRGAGTSLSGQCCNVAVVLDFSKYMRRLVSLDPRKKIAIVEPGIVLDRVREAAEVHHLTFPPDPATHSRCTIGGMIGNNSCGTHSVMGGLTANNIRSLDILLYDGTRMTVGATTDEEISAIIARGGRPGEIYAGLRRIRDQYADEIRRRFPNIPRRVSGYNLDELLPERGFQVARALVGGEGTLATVLRATLDLMHSPPSRRLAILGFPDPFLAADAVPAIIRHNPIGLEGVDSMLLDFMRRKNLAVDDMQLLPEGGAFLLTEFGAETDEEAEAKAHALLAASSRFPGSPTGRVCTLEEAPRLWHIRESALGSTVFVPGEPHGWEGWEDAAVPPDQLGSYLRQLWALMKTYGYRSPMYGHFGQGCVHTRINFDLESEPGIRKFRAFLDDATDIVIAHGGSLSGEHGDGRARAALLPKMFGPDLMQAFREFKTLWDPDNRMNPAILMEPAPAASASGSSHFSRNDQALKGPESIRAETAHEKQPALASLREAQTVEAPAFRPGNETPTEQGALAPEGILPIYQPDESFRLGAGYVSKKPTTFFQFPDDNGSFGEATLRCVGVGACRKEHAGTMCPSYMATREEQHSTRGRAHLLWELMEGKVLGSSSGPTDWRNDAVREALDLCLSCKACKSECPVNVDVATYKAEFLAHYYGNRLRKPQHYAFGFMDRLAHLSSLIPSLTPRLANLPLALPGLSHAIKAILGVAPQRKLPRFAPRSFQSEWKRSSGTFGSGHEFTRADQNSRSGASAPETSSPGVRGAEAPAFRPGNKTPQEEGASAPVREARGVEAPAFRPGNKTPQNEGASAPEDALKGHDSSRTDQNPQDKGASAPVREAQTVEAPAFRPGNMTPQNEGASAPEDALKGHDSSRTDQNPQDKGASAPVREAQTVEAPAFRPGNMTPQNEGASAPEDALKGHDSSRTDQNPQDKGASAPVREAQTVEAPAFRPGNKTPQEEGALAPEDALKGHDSSRTDQNPQDKGASAPVREAQTVEAPAFRPGNKTPQEEGASAPEDALKGHEFTRADQNTQKEGALAPETSSPGARGVEAPAFRPGNKTPQEEGALAPEDALKGHDSSRTDQNPQDKGASAPVREAQTVEAPAFRPGNMTPQNEGALAPEDALKGHDSSRTDQNPQDKGALAPVREAQTAEAPAFRPGNKTPQNEGALAPEDALKGHDFSRADQNTQKEGALAPVREARPAAPQVLLWPDTWNNYYHPQSLHAAAQVLEAAGFAPEVPRHHVCCGRPLYDFGFLKQARAYLEKILHDFAPQIDAGLPFVFLEPSCASVFRDELVNFFPPGSEHGPRAQRLRDQTLLLSEFLVRHAPHFQPPQLPGRKIVLQGHCHHKSVMKMTDELAILRRTGADVSLLDSGCCGMAGPFGFERDKFVVSQALGERVLLPAVRAAAPDTLLIADGFSCREQIAQNTDRRALHFAELLASTPPK